MLHGSLRTVLTKSMLGHHIKSPEVAEQELSQNLCRPKVLKNLQFEKYYLFLV